MRTRFLSLTCVLLGALAVPAFSQDANRDAVSTVTDARTIVRKLADRTGDFKNDFNNAVEHSLMDGTKLEDRAKHRADDLHDAAKKLQDVFGDKKDKNDPKVRDQVDKTLAAAADVNRVMAGHRFTDKVQREWELLRIDLNALAQIYSLSQI
jgi:hypothetical protein